MTYQVIRQFKLKGAVQTLGSFINLSDQAAVKLQGFVQAVPDEQPTVFEKGSDPVSCRYWFQVCWAVRMYQDQCQRNTTCRVYQFLEKQESSGGG